ncbi:hypothetical protein ONS95_014914 [Cadophora gregata]|uniref:uncharacterized protein n=1 Tax=Cadophora gregata TaxID=51156 RepID=UPI0026DBF786|nr:uncharacterized protein ONS95_014914 [Cadophora gregata]KAK0113219.1 hypothetical protein ONS95_014914 [Cadophora gregata]KAK0125261.1 hypothetical protein ONS96_009116 [Cadophora gregata f. sp. sojae]
MRRNHLALFLAIPSAMALSLSNFQEITSTAIPLSCLLTYDTQISDCKKKDFNKGCSDDCVQNLLDIQSDVQDVCSTILVNPSTLLGIVKSGGIVAALCPTLGSTTTSTSSTSATPQIIVTIPTSSPGVQVPKTSSIVIVQPTASTTARSSLTIISLSIVSSMASSTSPAVFTTSTTSTAEAPQTTATTASSTTTPEAVPVSTTTSNKAAAAASSSSRSKATPKPDPGSGGGSPFDIASGGNMIGYNPVFSVGLVLAWAGYFLGR